MPLSSAPPPWRKAMRRLRNGWLVSWTGFRLLALQWPDRFRLCGRECVTEVVSTPKTPIAGSKYARAPYR